MTFVVYDGPYGSIEVPALGLVVRRGEPVDAPAETARALRRQGWTIPDPFEGDEQDAPEAAEAAPVDVDQDQGDAPRKDDI